MSRIVSGLSSPPIPLTVSHTLSLPGPPPRRRRPPDRPSERTQGRNVRGRVPSLQAERHSTARGNLSRRTNGILQGYYITGRLPLGSVVGLVPSHSLSLRLPDSLFVCLSIYPPPATSSELSLTLSLHSTPPHAIHRIGKKLVDALLHENYAHKSRPLVSSREEAHEWLVRLMEAHNFLFRVEKQEGKVLEIDSKQFFEESAYYVWQWESPWTRIKSTLYSALLIVIVLAGVMFPLWPMELRTGVWYLSMFALSLLGGLFVLAIVRLIVFGITLVIPFTRPGLWLFPNLFADVGIVDSFIPFWGWHGIDYEAMHLKKYRKQQRQSGGKSSKKKSSSADKKEQHSHRGSAHSESEQDVKGKGRDPSQDEDDDFDDDIMEEVEAEARPTSKID